MRYLRGFSPIHPIFFSIVALVTFSRCINASGADLNLNDQCGEKGSMVIYTVSIGSSPNEVSAFGFDVQYDPVVLSYRRFSTGPLISGFDFSDANSVSPAIVRIGGFVAGPERIGKGEKGPIVSLFFDVVGQGDCKLRFSALEDDVKTWTTHGGKFTGGHAVDQEPAEALVPTTSERRESVFEPDPASGPRGDPSVTRYAAGPGPTPVNRPITKRVNSGAAFQSSQATNPANPAFSSKEFIMESDEPIGTRRFDEKAGIDGGSKQKGNRTWSSNEQRGLNLSNKKRTKEQNQEVPVKSTRSAKDLTEARSKSHARVVSSGEVDLSNLWEILDGTIILLASIYCLIIVILILVVGSIAWELIKRVRRRLIEV